MSKSIWHTADETPEQESLVVWEFGDKFHAGRFDTHYKSFCGPATLFTDLRKVKRWAKVDDLLALETELERTRKALDVARKALQELKDVIACPPDISYETGVSMYADGVLQEITALEQKDVK